MRVFDWAAQARPSRMRDGRLLPPPPRMLAWRRTSAAKNLKYFLTFVGALMVHVVYKTTPPWFGPRSLLVSLAVLPGLLDAPSYSSLYHKIWNPDTASYTLGLDTGIRTWCMGLTAMLAKIKRPPGKLMFIRFPYLCIGLNEYDV